MPSQSNIKYSLLILFTVILNTPQYSISDGRKINLAISEFELVGEFNENEQWFSRAVTDGISTGLSQINTIYVLERSNLEKVTKEIALQLSGLISDESKIEIGQMLGADQMLVGNIYKQSDQLQVNCRLIEIKSGRIIKGFEQNGIVDNLFILQNRLLKQLVSYFVFADSIKMPLSETGMENRDYRTIEKIKETLSNLPPLRLDPKRKRKSTNYMRILDQLENFAERYPNLIEINQIIVKVLIQLEDFDSASDQITKLQTMSNNKKEIELLQAELDYYSKDYIAASENIQNYLEQTSSNAFAWYIFAKTNLKLEKKISAAICFLKALTYSPYIREAETSLKTILMGSEGKMIIEDVEKSDAVLGWLGKLYIAYWSENDNQANALLNLPNIFHSKYYLSQFMIGKISMTKKLYIKSITALEASLKINPDFTVVHKYLGIALIESDQKSSGRNHLRAYLVLANHIDDFSIIDKYLNK